MKKFFYMAFLTSVVSLASVNSSTKPQADISEQNNTKPEITEVKHPDWSRNAVMYEVNIRQYTPEGTFKAFSEYLPQLKDLGVDILWLMPVHPISELNKKGELGSYYAVQNYLEVNPEFGTLDDFKALVNKAHDMGFKVILDWVANHTGGDNVWTVEHPEWYARDSVGDFTSPYDWTDTYKLNYDNEGMKAAMLSAMEYWVKECDIDGYRCDVAYEVPTSFWDNARKKLDEIKPIFMLAEAEHPDLTCKAFDMVYNWPLKDLMAVIAKGKNNKDNIDGYNHQSDVIISEGAKSATYIDTLLIQQEKAFPKDVYQMNHITNHDLNSWEGTEFERLGDGVRAFAVLTYTLNGMPLIYTGQEVGYDHAIEFFKKDAVPTSVLKPNDTFEFYKKLNALKHSQKALAAGIEGGEMVRYETVSPDAYVFERSKGDSRVVVFLNLSSSPINLVYKDQSPEGELNDYFKGSASSFPTNLAPWEYKVFVK